MTPERDSLTASVVLAIMVLVLAAVAGFVYAPDPLIAEAKLRARRRRRLIVGAALVVGLVAVAVNFAARPSGGARLGSGIGHHRTATDALGPVPHRGFTPARHNYILRLNNSECTPAPLFKESPSSTAIQPQYCFVSSRG